MSRNIRVIMTIEVDLEIAEDITVEEAIERFCISDAWYSEDIWAESYSIQEYKEEK